VTVVCFARMTSNVVFFGSVYAYRYDHIFDHILSESKL
jgi:hypothetical protein